MTISAETAATTFSSAAVTPLAPPLTAFSPTHRAVLRAAFSAFLRPLTADEEKALLERARALRVAQSKNNSNNNKNNNKNKNDSASSLSDAENDKAVIQLARADGAAPEVLDAVLNKLVAVAPADKLWQLTLVLGLLATSAGALVLTGSASPMNEASEDVVRTQILAMATSRFAALRGVVRVLQGTANFMFAATNFTALTPALSPNPLWAAMRYPGPDPNLAKVDRSAFYRHQFRTVDEILRTNYDVIIVGSGCGGGVVASELAKTAKVLVLEKGTYIHPSEMTLRMDDAWNTMYESGGFLQTEDSSMNILAGSTWGGGSTVNWSASLVPQHYVREEWATRFGLKQFLTDEFQNSMQHVLNVMGVSPDHLEHNQVNQLLMDSSKELGYHAVNIPQNTGGKAHKCGWCSLGCPYDEKQGTNVSWLRIAAKDGADFAQNAFVHRILRREDGTAEGVEVSFGEGAGEPGSNAKKFRLNSKIVVVSCGSLHTPPLLQRSGLKNQHIGQHLYLHPVTFALGSFPERDFKPYEGPIMTGLSNVVENVDGNHYGAKIEVVFNHPSVYAGILTSWTTPLQVKMDILEYPNTAGLLVLTRDRDGGRVEMDATGRPRLFYSVSPHDSESMLRGIIAGLKILVNAGATTVRTTQRGVRRFTVGKDKLADPAFEAYLREVQEAGIKANSVSMGSAHQMGTCRLAINASEGPLKPTGETWESANLYVADASVLPTASGVNPMVTTMSCAHMIAQNIKKALSTKAKI